MKLNYEELEAKCSALAAENAGLKNALEWLYETVSSEGVSVPDENYSSVTNAAQVLSETPATDAFLAEVRAGAIEHAAAERWGSGYIFNELNELAAQIRKGVQS